MHSTVSVMSISCDGLSEGCSSAQTNKDMVKVGKQEGKTEMGEDGTLTQTLC